MSLSIIGVLAACYQPWVSAMVEKTSKTFIIHNNYLCLFIHQKQTTYVLFILLLYTYYYFLYFHFFLYILHL